MNPMRALLSASLVALVGCSAADVTSPGKARLATAPGARLVTYEGQQWYDSATAAELTSLVWVETVAQAWFSGSGAAYAEGVSQGWGNVVNQTLSLRVWEGTTPVGGDPGLSRAGIREPLPYTFVLRDTVNLNFRKSCGLQSTASAYALAKFDAISLSSWSVLTISEREGEDEGNGYMNPCPPPPEDCDDPFTNEVEECDPPGGPAPGPIQVDVPQPTLAPPGSGPETLVCETYFEFTSWDGGATWYHTGTTVTNNCWVLMS